MSMTYDQLKEIFLKLTYILRGYTLEDFNDPSSEAQRLIRYSYEVNNQPFQTIEDGCSYLWLTYRDANLGSQMSFIEIFNDITEQIDIKMSQLRLLNVNWTFYGDTAQENSYNFRQKLFSKAAKDFLDQYDIKLVLDVPECTMLHEEVNNQWWQRVDLQVGYYITSTINDSADTLVGVDIYLETETKEKHIEIESEENE